MVKFLNYLKQMNKKLVNYKYGDNLSNYININNYLLKNYNKTIISGGKYDFDINQKKCIDVGVNGSFDTIEMCNLSHSKPINVVTNSNTPKTGTDVLLNAFQKLTDEMLEYISKSYNPNSNNDPTDYKKIAKYLLFNVEVLSQYFPNDSLNELSNQINSINTIIDQKLKEIQNLSS